jgi:hypothetical protein
MSTNGPDIRQFGGGGDDEKTFPGMHLAPYVM